MYILSNSLPHTHTCSILSSASLWTSSEFMNNIFRQYHSYASGNMLLNIICMCRKHVVKYQSHTYLNICDKSNIQVWMMTSPANWHLWLSYMTILQDLHLNVLLILQPKTKQKFGKHVLQHHFHHIWNIRSSEMTISTSDSSITKRTSWSNLLVSTMVVPQITTSDSAMTLNTIVTAIVSSINLSNNERLCRCSDLEQSANKCKRIWPHIARIHFINHRKDNNLSHSICSKIFVQLT